MKKTPGDINILYIYILNNDHMMHDSWNVRHNRQFLSFRTIFCPFTTLTTQKIKILKNWKKHLNILSFYTCSMNDNHIIYYSSWNMECDQNRFLSFWKILCPFTSLTTNNLDDQNFEMKKTSGVIIFLHKYTINNNHMMYDSWDTECKRQFFVIFWVIFCPFTPLKNQKIKIWKKWKRLRDIIILLKCTRKHDHMLHCSWDMARDRCSLYLSFWDIFCPFTPLMTQKIKFFKKWKKHLEMLSFYTCVPKIMIT